jgi:Malonyl-CoA decarboxylase C-terminal domain
MPSVYECAMSGRPAQLREVAARYLVEEKKRGAALDSVANFHLRNGASIDRILERADDSKIRREESFGIMVSYTCDPHALDKNASEYVLTGSVPCSEEVRALLASSAKSTIISSKFARRRPPC